MNEPGCPSRALFFCAGLARVHRRPVRETELRKRGAMQVHALKLPRQRWPSPFFVPIVPLAGELCPRRLDSCCAGPLRDHGRARLEMSREKSRDFPTNRPELSAIRSVDCTEVAGRHGICKTHANKMRHNCRRFEDTHDLEPSPRRPYYDQSMPPFPPLKRHLSRPVKYP